MNFVQIAGIIVGMLLFGALGDILGRQWGRCGCRGGVSKLGSGFQRRREATLNLPCPSHTSALLKQSTRLDSQPQTAPTPHPAVQP